MRDEHDRLRPLRPLFFARSLHRRRDHLRGLNQTREEPVGPLSLSRPESDGSAEPDSASPAHSGQERRVIAGRSVGVNAFGPVQIEQTLHLFDESNMPHRLGVVVEVQLSPPPQCRIAIPQSFLEGLPGVVLRPGSKCFCPIGGGSIEQHLGVVTERTQRARERDRGSGQGRRCRLRTRDHLLAPAVRGAGCVHLEAAKEKKLISQAVPPVWPGRPEDRASHSARR